MVRHNRAAGPLSGGPLSHTGKDCMEKSFCAFPQVDAVFLTDGNDGCLTLEQHREGEYPCFIKIPMHDDSLSLLIEALTQARDGTLPWSGTPDA